MLKGYMGIYKGTQRTQSPHSLAKNQRLGGNRGRGVALLGSWALTTRAMRPGGSCIKP